MIWKRTGGGSTPPSSRTSSIRLAEANRQHVGIQEALGRTRQHGMLARPGSWLRESVAAGSSARDQANRATERQVRPEQQLTIVEILLRTPTSRPT